MDKSLCTLYQEMTGMLPVVWGTLHYRVNWNPGFSTSIFKREVWLCAFVLSHSVVSSSFAPHLDCSLPGSSVFGMFPARVMEWVAIFLLQEIFPAQRSNLHLHASRPAGRFFTYWAISEAQSVVKECVLEATLTRSSDCGFPLCWFS